MKKQLLSFAFLLTVIACGGLTNISGTVSSSQTWDPAGSPYILSGTVTVTGYSLPVVTIEPGVQVLFNPGAELVIGYASNSNNRGGIIVNGSSEAPVLFSANQPEPEPGDWKNISFRQYTVAGALSFNHAVFEFGGSVSALVEVSSSAPSFSNCVFRHSATAGLNYSSSAANPVISDCSFQFNASYPLIWYPNRVEHLGSGNSFTGNGIQRILLRSQTVTTAQTWLDHGVPYEPEADLVVQCGTSPLTIEPGTELLFRAGKMLQLGHTSNSNYTGSLNAQGVSFSGLESTPGYWKGIFLAQYSSPPNSTVAGSTVDYAGYLNNTVNSAVYLTGGTGIDLDGCVIRNCSGWAVYMVQNASQPVIDNCLFANNLRSISLHLNDAWRLGEGNQFTGSTDLRPEIRSGTLSSSSTLVNPGLPWFVNGNLTLYGSANPIWTISSGTVLEMASDAKITVGGTSSSASGGSIVAQNVTFKADYIYRWRGFDFLIYGDASSLSNCVIRDFGSSNAPGIMAGSNGSLSIDGCLIDNGLGTAFISTGNRPFSFTNNTVSNCAVPITLGALDMRRLGSGNQYLNNTDNRVYCSGGNINVASTWLNPGIPIRIGADLTFNTSAGTVMTISYGNILEFASGAGFTISTTSSSANSCILRAYATTFRGETQIPGFWDGILIQYYGGNCLLSGCLIRDAGYGNASALTINASLGTFTGGTIRDCSAKGLYFGSSCRGSISGSVITACGSNPISLTANAVTNIGLDNSFVGNGIDRVEVRAETINNSTVWRDPGIPYQPTGTITITGSNHPHFKLMPGVVVLWGDHMGFTIGSATSASNRGSLEATEVLFTRAAETDIPNGLIYNTYIVESASLLTNCVIEFASHSTNHCAIFVTNSAPVFDGCEIRNGSGDGIMGTGTADFHVSNCTFSNLGGYPIKTAAAYFAAVSGVGNQFINCNPNRILASGGTLNTDAVWNNPGVPVEITSNLSVTSSSQPVLTINSGLVLLFRSETGLVLGTISSSSNRGGLRATGATFSALNATQGGWNGITFNNYAVAGSYLDNCVVEYAASNLYLNNHSLARVKDSVFRYGNYGLRATGSSVNFQISGCHFLQNTIGIHCSNSAYPVVGGSMDTSNAFMGNLDYAVQNTSTQTLNAEYNWWGHPDGPTVRDGDPIGGNIDYDPWRITNIGDGPYPFHLLSPGQAEVLTDLTPLLDWEEAIDPSPEDTVTYTIEYSFEPNFGPETVSVENLTQSYWIFPAGALSDDSRIWWRVKATDTQDQTTNSTEQDWYFDVAVPEPPSAFSLLAPAQDETLMFTSNRLSWTPAIDPDPGDLVSYWVYLDETAGFEAADSLLTTTCYAHTPFCQPGEIFYWRVKAFDQDGFERFSSTRRFYVHPDAGPRAPAEFTLSVMGNDLILEWDNVPGADGYKVWHADLPDGLVMLLGETDLNQFIHTGGAIAPKAFYRVVTIDSE